MIVRRLDPEKYSQVLPNASIISHNTILRCRQRSELKLWTYPVYRQVLRMWAVLLVFILQFIHLTVWVSEHKCIHSGSSCLAETLQNATMFGL
jgi:hypothetical protein